MFDDEGCRIENDITLDVNESLVYCCVPNIRNVVSVNRKEFKEKEATYMRHSCLTLDSFSAVHCVNLVSR